MNVTFWLEDHRVHIILADRTGESCFLTLVRPGGAKLTFVGAPADLLAMLATAAGAVEETMEAAHESGRTVRGAFVPGVRDEGEGS